MAGESAHSDSEFSNHVDHRTNMRTATTDYGGEDGTLLRKGLIRIGLSVSSSKEALEELAACLEEGGFVKSTFAKAVVERESEYPTGLSAGAFDIAIPHCAEENVNVTSMAVATLREPVEFGLMGSVGEWVHPQVLFMLAIKNPSSQIKVLQRVMRVIQNDALLRAIRESETADELYGLLAPEVN